MDVEHTWHFLHHSIRGAAEVVGYKPRKKQPWMSDETFKILSSKVVARDASDVIERRRLQRLFNSEARADMEAYYNRLAESVEEGLKHNSL